VEQLLDRSQITLFTREHECCRATRTWLTVTALSSTHMLT
jgi:hypothetical protein